MLKMFPTLTDDIAYFNNKVEELALSTQPKEGRRLSEQVYRDMLNFYGGNDQVAKKRIYDVLGTSRSAAYILSHVERDLGSKWEVFS